MERTEVRKDLVSVLVEVRYLKKMLNFIKFASLFFLEKCLCRSDDVLSIKNGVSVRLFTDTGKYTLTFWCLIRCNLPIFDEIHIFSQKRS